MNDRKSTSRRRRALQAEFLDNRALLSGSLAPTISAAVQPVPKAASLTGNFVGSGRVTFSSPTEASVTSLGFGDISYHGQYIPVAVEAHHVVNISSSNGLTVATDTSGEATFTARDGDRFCIEYSGTGTPNGIGFDDTFNFTVTHATGRFAQAVGKVGVIHSSDVAPPLNNNYPFVADIEAP